MASFRADTSEFKPTGVRLGMQRTFSTSFAGTENPLSEGGNWISGAVSGIFQDVRCTPGFAFGAGPSASPPYDDPTSVVSGGWGPVQTAEATVRVDAIESGVNQEVELRLLTTITPGFIRGYEIMWSITTNTYIDVRRWEGLANDIGQFVQLGFTGSGTSPQLVTGYRVKATIDSAGVIRAYTDSGAGYVLMCTATADLTYRTGAPGIGFFKHAGAAGALTGYGYSLFTCSSAST